MSPLLPNGSLAVDDRDLELLRAATGDARPTVALVLGSGLAGVARAARVAGSVPFADLPGWPRPRSAHVIGHKGAVTFGTMGPLVAMIFEGRLHTYQGVSALEAAYPVRLAAALGIETVVLTNAAGGVCESIPGGSLVALSDQINLMADSPLTGWSGPEGGTPFVPMADAFDPHLRALAYDAAGALGIELLDGVYAGVRGPAYEAPAEVEWLRRIGADIVGMSTVPETIAARALGMRVLGISLVTNQAGAHDLDHAEVLETGRRAAQRMESLLLAILQRLK